MKIVAIIPARMASSRFPGKPLVDILGLSMIEHVRRRVALCPEIHKTIVATCDAEIQQAVESQGGEVIMTAETHERCTDRIAEAAQSLEADIIINIQGDEPFVRPEMLSVLLPPLVAEKELSCTNLMTVIEDEQEWKNPNVVKTVCDLKNNAVYFSREPIPSGLKAPDPTFKKYKQLGIIAFRKNFLEHFTALAPTPLENIESVDMMRAIEHGYPVRMVVTPFQVIGVDTPEDLKQAIALMEHDDLMPSYFDK